MAKTEVYSWRLAPALKAALEEVARARNTTLAALLDEIARDWLDDHGADDSGAEERARERALRSVGSFGGGDPDRAAETRQRVRRRLAKRRGG